MVVIRYSDTMSPVDEFIISGTNLQQLPAILSEIQRSMIKGDPKCDRKPHVPAGPTFSPTAVWPISFRLEI